MHVVVLARLLPAVHEFSSSDHGHDYSPRARSDEPAEKPDKRRRFSRRHVFLRRLARKTVLEAGATHELEPAPPEALQPTSPAISRVTPLDRPSGRPRIDLMNSSTVWTDHGNRELQRPSRRESRVRPHVQEPEQERGNRRAHAQGGRRSTAWGAPCQAVS